MKVECSTLNCRNYAEKQEGLCSVCQSWLEQNAELARELDRVRDELMTAELMLYGTVPEKQEPFKETDV